MLSKKSSTARLLDGLLCASVLHTQIKKIVTGFQEQYGLGIRLDVLLLGDNPASLSYVCAKERAAQEIGIQVCIHRYPSSILPEKLTEELQKMQSDPHCNGILIQLPLPSEWEDRESCLHRMISHIAADKDVDGFTLENRGALFSNNPHALKPCTPMGILALLKAYDLSTRGKHICVIGRSSLVGNPIRHLLGQRPSPECNFSLGDAVVTQCHSQAGDLAEYCKHADILIAAAGVPYLVSEHMVKAGAIVIDVGINRIKGLSPKGYHLTGDVDFAAVASKASYISPVPNGVGRMTIAMLLYNTTRALALQNCLELPSLDWAAVQKKLEANGPSYVMVK